MSEAGLFERKAVIHSTVNEIPCLRLMDWSLQRIAFLFPGS